MIAEHVLEYLLFTFPAEFFSEVALEPHAKQVRLAGKNCLDFSLKHNESYLLFEVKRAGKANAALLGQIRKYMDELDRRGYASCSSPFPVRPKPCAVAPVVPASVASELGAQGIQIFEIPEEKFVEVADAHHVPLVWEPATGLQLRFWRELDRNLRAHGSPLRFTLPEGDKDYRNLLLGRGLSGMNLTLRFSPKHNSLDVDLTFGRLNSATFASFCRDHRPAVDASLRRAPLWWKQDSESHVRTQLFAWVRDANLWESYFDWFRSEGEVMLAWCERLREAR